MGVGRRIKQRREQLGLTQVQLAELLGVSPGNVGNWETEVNAPKEAQFHKLFDVLKVEPNFLFQDYITEAPQDISIEESREQVIELVENINDIETLKKIICYVDYLIWEEEQRS